MRRLVMVGVGTLALAGCIPQGRGPRPIPIEGDSITYATGPCHGFCPVYSVTVRPDGSGVFDGKQHTAVSGERRFTLTRAQYDAFAHRLAPYRPETGTVRYDQGEPLCQQWATDLPSVDIRWTRAIGDSQNLYYDFGCDRAKTQAMRDALGGAVETLPIAELIGPRP